MGLVQKIFYYHVPGAILMLVLAIVAGVASGIYLFKKTPWADHWALAAAEQVVLFGAMTFVTGPLWGRKAWGVWWDWDPRTTSALMLWMIFHGLSAPAAIRRARLRQARSRHGAVGPGQCAVRVCVGELLAHAAPEDYGHPIAGAADGRADVVLHGGVRPVVDGACSCCACNWRSSEPGSKPSTSLPTRNDAIDRISAPLMVVLVAAGPAQVVAQPPQQPPPQQDEFVPLDQLPPEEQMPAAPMVVAAYAFIWIAFIVYVFTLVKRLRKVEEDVQRSSGARG